MKTPYTYSESNSATYSPEDDKLRLYVGRVPRDEYERLRAEGWTSTPKQNCDFVAVWTPGRVQTCIDYAGIIGDEDQGPEDRAADRAERFSEYRDKRTSEAVGQADRYDSGPSAHGFQNQARAERSAARYDRIATHAVDAWSKAEYWTRRTAGVISNALYKSSPGVRMGRIKTIEAELRGLEKTQEECAKAYRQAASIAENPGELVAYIMKRFDKDEAGASRDVCEILAGHGKHLNPANLDTPAGYYFEHIKSENPPTVADYAARYLSTHRAPDSEAWAETSISKWINHCTLRLAYENQMLEAQGGRAAFVEMEVGGWIGSHQIRKVNKSNATGRVVSVTVGVMSHLDRWGNQLDSGPKMRLKLITVERLPADAYRAPTAEEKAALQDTKKAEKKAAPKKDPRPIINPTDEDAQRLIDLWNAARRENHEKKKSYESTFTPSEIRRMPQAFYSEHSKGSYAKAGTQKLCSLGRLDGRNQFYDYSGQAERAKARGPAVCQIRATGYDPVHLVIIIDKPQKPFPASVWEAYTPAEALTLSA